MFAKLLLFGFLAQAGGQHVKAELVTSVTSAQPGKSFIAAVVLRTDPGWHVYWTNPGDSGMATSVTWKLPEGWKASELMWPVPSRFAEKELVTFGYEGSTMLMARITPSAEAKVGPISFTADVSWLACKEACIPGKTTLRRSLSVSQSELASTLWSDRLIAAEQSLPAAPTGWTFEAEVIEGGFLLKTKPPTKLEKANALPSFFPMTEGMIDHAWPQRLVEQEDGSFWIGLKRSQFLKEDPAKLRGILIAPRGTKWENKFDAILVEAIIKPKGDSL